MRVFFCNNFRGYWPVGTSAVIVARDLDEAHVMLNNKLIAMGLRDDQEKMTVHELKTDSTCVIVLQDGNY